MKTLVKLPNPTSKLGDLRRRKEKLAEESQAIGREVNAGSVRWSGERMSAPSDSRKSALIRRAQEIAEQRTAVTTDLKLLEQEEGSRLWAELAAQPDYVALVNAAVQSVAVNLEPLAMLYQAQYEAHQAGVRIPAHAEVPHSMRIALREFRAFVRDTGAPIETLPPACRAIVKGDVFLP